MILAIHHVWNAFDIYAFPRLQVFEYKSYQMLVYMWDGFALLVREFNTSENLRVFKIIVAPINNLLRLRIRRRRP